MISLLINSIPSTHLVQNLFGEAGSHVNKVGTPAPSRVTSRAAPVVTRLTNCDNVINSGPQGRADFNNVVLK